MSIGPTMQMPRRSSDVLGSVGCFTTFVWYGGPMIVAAIRQFVAIPFSIVLVPLLAAHWLRGRALARSGRLRDGDRYPNWLYISWASAVVLVDIAGAKTPRLLGFVLLAGLALSPVIAAGLMLWRLRKTSASVEGIQKTPS